MITEDDKRRLAELAFRALDTIERDYGEDVVFEDAILIYEVTRKSDSSTEGNWEATSSRAAVNVGMLTLTVALMTTPDRPDDD